MTTKKKKRKTKTKRKKRRKACRGEGAEASQAEDDAAALASDAATARELRSRDTAKKIPHTQTGVQSSFTRPSARVRH